jgi:CHAT domain-containing protein
MTGWAQNTPASEPRPRLHWCPTGAFAFVPVHAAGIYEGPDQECCADYVISSYTPTLTALLRAQHRAPTYRPEQVHLLALAVERAHDRSLPRLRFVEREAALALEIAAAAGAASSQAPDDAGAGAVVAALESMHMVHLACHGIQHDSAPLESRFCLGGGNLTVAELMRSELKGAFCAFLSACETAKGDRAHADEAVHLAATMLFAGFRSVVATMW